jgi:putative SOS response-associated peptidase YedK
MEQVHNSKMRMPTILNDDLAYEWMFGDLSEERIKEIASTQLPASEMTVHTISPQFQGLSDPTEPYDYGIELPPLDIAV